MKGKEGWIERDRGRTEEEGRKEGGKERKLLGRKGGGSREGELYYIHYTHSSVGFQPVKCIPDFWSKYTRWWKAVMGPGKDSPLLTTQARRGC